MSRTIRCLLSVSAISVALGAFGCAGPVDGLPSDEFDAELIRSEERALLPAGCTALGPGPHNHTCLHGMYGPFGAVTAASNENFAGSTPKLDVIHTYYTVTLPAVGGGVYRGTVKFTPANNDDHIVYVKPSVAVTVKNKSGTVIASQLSSTVATCPLYLSNYSVHALNKSSTVSPYKMTFEATTSTTQVVLEEVLPLRERWYQDSDGDGYGPPTPSQLTACLPSAGYATTTAGDCNDSNSAVYPGSGCP